MAINYDILVYIMTFLRIVKRGSLFALMKTCRILYTAGAPYLLAGQVNFDGKPDQMESFNCFMHQNLALRGSFIRRIHLNVPDLWEDNIYEDSYDYQTDILQRSSEVLKHCSRLQHLEILGSEDWLSMGRRLGPALASLVDVEYVMFGGKGDRTDGLLRITNWPLKAMCISFAYDDASDGDYKGDPRTLLRHVYDLKEVHVEWLDFGPEGEGETFPHLETFSVEFWGDIGMRPLLESFPKLRNLRIYAAVSELQAMDEIRLVAIRHRNIQAQVSHRWSHLDYVEGELVAVYLLAPQCHIAHLNIPLPSDDDAQRYWFAVIGDARPIRLTFYVSFKNYQPIILQKLTPPSFPIPTTHLDLTLSMSFSPASMEDVETNILDFLGSLSLTFLQVTLEWTPTPDSMRYFPRDIAEDRFAEYFDKLEPAAFASRLVRYTRTLQYIILGLPRCKDLLYWRVEQGGSGPTLVPMSKAEGQLMRERQMPKQKSELDRFDIFDVQPN
ncbi:unnamed protein product [Somion occarium]|uniref:F-box domain-containing protein n=1 Tax=Somion occarium TaxID=3059160 RepID=A0ABP1EB40_9APHY